MTKRFSVQRTIEGFHQDEHGDWVAELRCGHGQHVRHKPPFWSRPWVVTEAGRNAKLGCELPCVLCDRFEIPAGYSPYKRTIELTTQSIPDALKQQHSTKAGVWAVIHVLEGRMRYIVEPPLEHQETLEAGSRGVIAPEVLHHVMPEGDVRFFVEFHRRGT
jgi:tellurite methyltransferase